MHRDPQRELARNESLELVQKMRTRFVLHAIHEMRIEGLGLARADRGQVPRAGQKWRDADAPRNPELRLAGVAARKKVAIRALDANFAAGIDALYRSAR